MFGVQIEILIKTNYVKALVLFKLQ